MIDMVGFREILPKLTLRRTLKGLSEKELFSPLTGDSMLRLRRLRNAGRADRPRLGRPLLLDRLGSRAARASGPKLALSLRVWMARINASSMATQFLIRKIRGHVARSPAIVASIMNSGVGFIIICKYSLGLISGKILMSPVYCWLKTDAQRYHLWGKPRSANC